MTDKLPTISIKGKGRHQFTCIVCTNVFYRWKYQKSIFCGRKCMGIYSSKNPNKGNFVYTAKRGKEHHKWTESPKYSTLHQWVSRKLEKKNKCSLCNKKNNSTEWANISKNYLRNLNDWIELCGPCHYGFDNKLKTMYSKYGKDYFKNIGKKGLTARWGGENYANTNTR